MVRGSKAAFGFTTDPGRRDVLVRPHPGRRAVPRGDRGGHPGGLARVRARGVRRGTVALRGNHRGHRRRGLRRPLLRRPETRIWSTPEMVLVGDAAHAASPADAPGRVDGARGQRRARAVPARPAGPGVGVRGVRRTSPRARREAGGGERGPGRRRKAAAGSTRTTSTGTRRSPRRAARVADHQFRRQPHRFRGRRCSIIASSAPAAAVPKPGLSWATVVSAGSTRDATSMSSKPTTDRSAGTDKPAARAASRAPTAISSLAANTAVGGSLRASSRRIPTNPLSR